MPWTSKDAHRHTHYANTPAKQQKWAAIAEGLRKKGVSEGSAIRIANATVHRAGKKAKAKRHGK